MTPKFKRCVLHIGVEKTGTTSLQTFLHANRPALNAAGFFVPASLSPHSQLANHERLATYALAARKLHDDLRQSVRVADAAAIAPHRAEIVRDLRAEIAEFAQTRAPADSVLLLSNEHCHSRLIEVSEVQRLRHLLCGFAHEIDIVVYLRPQHELAVSLYDQAMKGGYYDIPIPPIFSMPASSGPVKRWVTRGYFDFNDLLVRWAEVFGQDRLDVRIYDPATFPERSITHDFIARLGIATSGLDFTRDTNVSMSAERQIALNAVNRFVDQHNVAFTPRDRLALVQQMQSISAGRGYRPSRDAAVRFYNSFALSNEQARARFLPHRPALFEANFSGYPDEDNAVAESGAMASTLLALHRTILGLKAGTDPR